MAVTIFSGPSRVSSSEPRLAQLRSGKQLFHTLPSAAPAENRAVPGSPLPKHTSKLFALVVSRTEQEFVEGESQ